jgi:hypothetical protein
VSRAQTEYVRDRGTEEGGRMMEEVTGAWRKMRNEELHDLYPSSNVIFFFAWLDDPSGPRPPL